HLEVKRMIFPRFYFLSNAELLDILAESKNPDVVQPHLVKCFANIRKIYIRPQEQRPPWGPANSGDRTVRHHGPNTYVALVIPEGLLFVLFWSIRIRGPAEQWLGNVESTMYDMVQKFITVGMAEWDQMEFKEWFFTHPGQVILLVSQIMFTQECEVCLRSSNSKKEMISGRNDLINLIEQLAEIASEVLPYHKESTLEALVTLFIHCREILTALLDHDICNLEDFEWTRQLRYEWHDAYPCRVIQGFASFEYGYEYLGCSPRLVITPLTDRCWLTVTGALQLNLGGCLAGPAGTGKTETVKDLSKALGKLCLSFNCSEGLDDQVMGKLFCGLVQSGAWCCFDEFNRIDIEVLSTVASQIQTIKAAKDSFTVRFVLEGKEIRLKPFCAIFITLNPGYKGRVELPDNLKSLFRPVSMMVPDYELIAEIMLFSKGFKSAKTLSGKIVNLYHLCSKQLSQQDHYDFGMRAIKTVLIRAGQKRQELKSHNKKKMFSTMEESLIIISVLKEVNLPKFLTDDASLFEDILTDLFPGVKIPKVNPKQLESAVSFAIQHLYLQSWESQIEKVIQFYNQIMARVGVMLIGPTGGGKTTIRTILEKALIVLPLVDIDSSTKGKVDTFVINPKCVTLGELFGETNLSTMEWSDGLLSSAVRNFAKLAVRKPKKKDANEIINDWQWIILDGPVDPVWIENLNSVLDDTRMLCLANSERIYLSPGIRMIFEVDSLSQASPATVSRCAMVYVDPTDLGWQPYVKSWMEDFSDLIAQNDIEYLESLFHSSIQRGIEFLNKHKKMQAFSVQQMGVVMNICRIVGKEDVKQPNKLMVLLGKLFIFAFTWAVGGILRREEEHEGETLIGINTSHDDLANIPSGDKTIFDYFVDLQTGEFEPWGNLVPSTQLLIQKENKERKTETLTFIPNIDTIRHSFLTSLLLMNKHPVLVIGDPGSGKTAMIEDMFGRLQKQSVGSTRSAIISTLQLGAHTSAAQTKAWIIQKLILKNKDILGAPKSKQVLLFIDDLNMPVAEEYGSQPPLELIRQLLDLGGIYDTQHLEWKYVQDVSLVASCMSTSEGSNEISARLLTHFCTLCLPSTSLQSLQRIFQACKNGKCKDYLTCASIALYYRMFNKMRPTPAKCHYTFNLRDLFKLLPGLLQAHPSVIVSKETTALLFVHESTRVFHDRLIDSADKEIFYQFLSNELNNYFKISWTKEKMMDDSPIFVDFLEPNTPVEKRIYRNITSQKRLLLLLEESYLRMQSLKPQSTAIVFFKEAVQHITRAARIFRQEGAHMTMIGLDGNGKVTCASLACCLSNCILYRLSITCNYSFVNFRDDLKKVYKQAGLEGKRVVFLITDSEIIQEAFLEDLSCILKSGQVADLFEKDELDNIITPLTSSAEKSKHSNKIEDVYSFFLQRVRCNLHVVLTISPAGIVFRQRCRTYPAIVNCCTVDWYKDWPEEALCHVAKSYFRYNDTFGNENFRNVLVDVCVNIHKDVSVIIEKYLKETKRHYYVTPNSYLQFIKTFSTILQSTKEKIVRDRTCYNSGLTKILEATSHITEMQEELFILGPQIEKKSQEIQELVEKLHKDAGMVEQVRTIVKQDEENMTAETRIVEEYAQQATEELNTVLPSLEKALNALDALDKGHIAEIRVYTRPPPLVLTVMNAVCILLQKKPTWTSAKLLLADPGFLKRLVTLDKDNLPEKVFVQLKQFVKSPDFSPVKVGLVSVACCSICQWILALDHYHNVQKVVRPKREARVQISQPELKAGRKEREIDPIEQHQQNLEAKYAEGIAEQESLAARKDQTTCRLYSASVLSTALKDEMERWKESVDNFDQRLQGIIGDALVSAACIVYSGVLSAGYRQQIVDECVRLCHENRLPVSPYYSLINCMTEKNEVRKWQNAGLPLDQYSTENAILVMYGQRWPLLIDPERQAYKWIYQMAGGKLQEISATDASYLRKLENSMRIGESVLLQDLTETLDSSMKSILKKEIFNKGGQDFIRIGDSEIELNKNFRLCMTTQKANPHFLPAICNAVTMINFTVTFQALQDQLLSAVVIKEKPELEQKRWELLESISTDLVTLRELEQKSLRLLQKTDGHLLDDQDLIDNLQKTKITSTEIFERVEASATTEATIETLRKGYLPIANRGAVLYFVVLDLFHINYMYQFSLEWFCKMFSDSIDDVAKQKSETDCLKRHVNDIIEKLTSNVYKTVSSALFSENQLCFSFLLCTAIMKNNSEENQFNNNLGFIQENEWNFFLHSSSYAFTTSPPPHWITEIMWKECQYMSTHMPAFSLLCESLSSNSQQWRAFLNSQNLYYLISTPYRPVPLQQGKGRWHLWPFRFLRLESLNSAVRAFITEKMGSKYLWTGGIDFKAIYEESDSTTPLILIHAHGVDIAAVLLRLAQEIKGNTQHVKMISLGRGQGSKAEELIYKSQILEGQWTFLQNCHLAASFMPRLCTIVDSLSQAYRNIDPNFRLWLSSIPDTSFPTYILRKGLKIVIESPQGLKGTLLQTFGLGGTELVTEAVFNKTSCGPSWKTLLFSLCFFNAVVHERKKYGALGWNIPYEFNSSDLEISIHMLELLLENQKEIPWAALSYLTGEVAYGGRVTDHWDRRCLLSVLDNFYNPSVLQEDFAYSVDWVYRPISQTDTLKDCRAYLRSLPEADSPELFGMHQCAEKAYLKSQAQFFVESIITTQPAISTDTIISGGRSQDEIILEIASDILIKLPLIVEDVGQAPETEEKFLLADLCPDSFTSSTFLTVLQQEIDQYNNLLAIIIQSLHTLQQGIRGDIIFTSGLEELYNSILKAKVPEQWQQHSYESHKPLGSWIDDLIIRVNFFAMWANRGHPSCFWLPGFFFPHGFLTAVLQNYARQNEIPVDSLTFVHKVLPLSQDEEQNLRSLKRKEVILNKAFKEPSQCENGIRMFGLYIDGACWSPITESLEELELHERFHALPDILFLPQKEEAVLLIYECPLYRTPQRSGMLSSTGVSTNFITAVSLPTLIAPSHWITRGVAMLCQLDD
uniref:AAA+ ATPase domain-containing protein n=1 Tax=Anolis carolinensis TaxID=28377 RepID=G1KEF2_ANOCA